MSQKISINWGGTYANEPTAVIQTEQVSKLKYRTYLIKTNGGLDFQPATTCEILYGKDEDSGYVWWISVGGSGGACGGTFEMEDGSVRTVKEGWHGSPPVVEEIEPVVSAVWERPKSLVGVSAFVTLERVQELVEEQLPDVEIIPAKHYGHTYKFKDYPSKEEWLKMEDERVSELRDRLKAKYAELYPDVPDWGAHGLYSYWSKDPEWVSARPYENIKEYIGETTAAK